MLVVTHNGVFHADEIFSLAMLKVIFEDINIIRTRDMEVINNGDIVVDVGGIYDTKNLRFDHHQRGFEFKRDGNEVKYSSFGLTFEHFHKELFKKLNIKEKHFERIFYSVDKELVQQIDAHDNGELEVKSCNKNNGEYIAVNTLSNAISVFNSLNNEGFYKAIEFAQIILTQSIYRSYEFIEAEEYIAEQYKNSTDERILVLEKFYPFQSVINKLEFNEICFVIFPDKVNGWRVQTVKDGFKNKVDLPKEWGGLEKDELKAVSNIEDIIFCHKGLFIAGAESKESALKIANISLLG